MKLICLFLVITLTSCSGAFGTMDGIMSSWEGENIDSAIDAWGYPDEEREINGRKIYLWHKDQQINFPNQSQTTGKIDPYTGSFRTNTTSTSSAPVNVSCTRILEVNDKNIIVKWEWKGNNCPFADWLQYSDWRNKKVSEQ